MKRKCCFECRKAHRSSKYCQTIKKHIIDDEIESKIYHEHKKMLSEKRKIVPRKIRSDKRRTVAAAVITTTTSEVNDGNNDDDDDKYVYNYSCDDLKAFDDLRFFRACVKEMPNFICEEDEAIIKDIEENRKQEASNPKNAKKLIHELFHSTNSK